MFGRHASRPTRAAASSSAFVFGVEAYRLDRLVMGLEVGVGDRPALVLVVDERGFVLAQRDVGVDERAAAQAARDDRAEAGEAPHVPQPVEAVARPPERVAADLARRARERARGIRPAALEQQHVATPLREPARRDRSTEAGADDDRVVGLHPRLSRHRPAR
jgi:hypothetical protein